MQAGSKRPKIDFDAREDESESDQVRSLRVQVTQQQAIMTHLLLIACEKGHTDVMHVLLSSRITDVNGVYNDQTLMYRAVAGRHVYAVAMLIRFGADVNHCRGGQIMTTPLHQAVTMGNVGVVDALIRAGSRLDVMCETGSSHTVLGVACLANNLELVKMLVGHGSHVNQQDAMGYSPMMLAAAATGDGEVAMFLIQGYANCDLVSSDGSTAMSIASVQNPKIVDRMRAAIHARGQRVERANDVRERSHRR